MIAGFGSQLGPDQGHLRDDKSAKGKAERLLEKDGAGKATCVQYRGS